MDKTWTIGRMLEWMQGYLAKHEDNAPLVSARWLLSDATGLSNMQLYTNLDRPLDAVELDKLRENVKRRAEGEPLQYISGKTVFRFIEVRVRKGVLIPRPETEVLVSEALALMPCERHHGDNDPIEPDLLVCDLCTGSGCIACSMAQENPRIRVLATDISEEAVKLARENVFELGLEDRIDVVECDLAQGVEEGLIGKIDAVVSNPPYIPTNELDVIPEEVSGYEPMLALDGGDDGLAVFRRICDWSITALRPGGFLAAELHEDTLDSARNVALDMGFRAVEIKRDLNNLPRVIIAFK